MQLYQENINLQEVLVRESKGSGSAAKNQSKVNKGGNNTLVGAFLNQAGAALATPGDKKDGSGGASVGQGGTNLSF